MMTKLNTLLALSTAIIAAPAMVACDVNTDGGASVDDDDAEDTAEEHHFGYEDDEFGPDHWGEESPACNGTNQSPIDIVAPAEQDLTNIAFNYLDSSVDGVVNNGHTIQVNVEPGTSKITVNGKDYELLQFHWHAQSEHTLDGVYSPMELHLVHKNSDTDLAVVSVLLDEGEENAAYTNLWASIPSEGDEQEIVTPFNPSDLLPTDRSFYTYSGSLTTPPCSEVVTWLVMDNKGTLSASQIADFTAFYDHNNRPIQASNGRQIQEDSAD